MNPLDKILSPELKVGKGGPEYNTKVKRLDVISKGILTSGCTSCKLAAARAPGEAPVPGEGRGRVMFVGHRIGRNEANEKRPAIGRVSQYGFGLLLKAFEELTGSDFRGHHNHARDLLLDYAYVTNAARCGPGEDVVPNSSVWSKCGQQWLAQEVRQVDPSIIVFWNKGVAQSAIHGPVPSMGTVEDAIVYGVKRPCMVMHHPAVIARDASYERVVRSEFETLVQWLQDQELCYKDPSIVRAIDIPAEHLFVRDKASLWRAIDDLKEYSWLGFDTETAFHGQFGSMSDLEMKKGAIMWHSEQFDLVCVQLCGLDADGAVRKTYTIACGFKDRYTGQPSQSLTPDDVVEALHVLFAHQVEEGGLRTVCIWNAGFDAPVMSRMGLDLLGFADPNTYPIRLIDGMLVLGRLNEHLGEIQQLSLDAASKMFLGEGKGGGFGAHFEISEFAYEDINNPARRAHLLEYTGEDPRKALLVTKAVLSELHAHAVDEVRQHVTEVPSSLPAMGFGPFPKPAADYTGSRLWDVAIPMDHQMINIIAGMEMVGFHLDLDKFTETEEYTRRMQQTLLDKIQEDKPQFNPNAGADVAAVVSGIFEELAAALIHVGAVAMPSVAKHMQVRFLEEISAPFLNPLGQQPGGGNTKNAPVPVTAIDFFYPKAAGVRTSAAFWADARDAAQAEEIRATRIAALTRGYNLGYGDLDAQQKTIEDKLFIYLEAGLVGFARACEKYGLTAELIAKAETAVDVAFYKTFFDRVFIYKQLGKKWSTYFDRFRRLADRDQIIHPQYGQRTSSGRFQGNFQNVPRGGAEDLKWIGKLLKAIGMELPEDEDEKKAVLNENNKLDVRQYISVLQAPDLNRLFSRFKSFRDETGKPWCVNESDRYVGVLADFAAQEDRMAYALSGDETKRKLLANPELDTHFYNVAFCFGELYNFDTNDESQVMDAYKFFTADKQYESMYRTPMKTVHYASTYGAAAAKLHTLLGPLFTRMNKNWPFSSTKTLKDRYDKLYEKVTAFREALITKLDTVPVIEFPVYGALRHAKIDPIEKEVMKSEYLSVANALNQGSSAYITKTAMLRMRHLIEMNAERWNLVQVGGDNYVGILLQVHDEIGVICPVHLSHEVALCLESAMKIIVGPPSEDHLDEYGDPLAFWDDTVQDHRNETGWLYIPDVAFEGVTLFDADAEFKVTIAKASVLSDGTRNVLAQMDDPESVAALMAEYGPARIQEDIPLVLARLGHAPLVF